MWLPNLIIRSFFFNALVGSVTPTSAVSSYIATMATTTIHRRVHARGLSISCISHVLLGLEAAHTSCSGTQDLHMRPFGYPPKFPGGLFFLLRAVHPSGGIWWRMCRPPEHRMFCFSQENQTSEVTTEHQMPSRVFVYI